jgi:hypothetical protein
MNLVPVRPGRKGREKSCKELGVQIVSQRMRTNAACATGTMFRVRFCRIAKPKPAASLAYSQADDRRGCSGEPGADPLGDRCGVGRDETDRRANCRGHDHSRADSGSRFLRDDEGPGPAAGEVPVAGKSRCVRPSARQSTRSAATADRGVEWREGEDGAAAVIVDKRKARQ